MNGTVVVARSALTNVQLSVPGSSSESHTLGTG